MIARNFWQDKKVFLTGHTGFKGSWLSLWLQELGANVCGYALEPPTTPNMYQDAQVEKGMQSVIADIRNYDALYSALSEFEPEIVIHMAAQPLVRLSYEQPVETYATNVMGTVNLLDCIRKTGGVKAIVNVTSDKCYENKEWVWGYRENEPKGGYDPYSNSKGCAELVADAFRKSYFNPEQYASHGCGLGSARAGNVIGGGDWAKDRLIPDMLAAFEKNEKVEIRSPHAIRPWQHVLEPLSGYLILAQRLYEQGADYAEGWNFGPADEDAKPVDWIVARLAKLWGENAAWYLSSGEHPHEAGYLKLDCSKAKAHLQWQPRWTLNETLVKIVAWHKAWLAQTDMREYSINEIKEYSVLEK